MSGLDAVYELHALRVSLRSAAGLRDEARLLRDERPDLARSCDRWADDHEASARRLLERLRCAGVDLDAETRALIDQQTGEPAALLEAAWNATHTALAKPMSAPARSSTERAMLALANALDHLDVRPAIDAVIVPAAAKAVAS